MISYDVASLATYFVFNRKGELWNMNIILIVVIYFLDNVSNSCQFRISKVYF